MSKQVGDKPRTTVEVTYALIRSDLPRAGACQITIYTATGPRQPVMARVKARTLTGATRLSREWSRVPLYGLRQRSR
jgi:hypothetical protein